jgi:hypothetical protein
MGAGRRAWGVALFAARRPGIETKRRRGGGASGQLFGGGRRRAARRKGWFCGALARPPGGRFQRAGDSGVGAGRYPTQKGKHTAGFWGPAAVAAAAAAGRRRRK